MNELNFPQPKGQKMLVIAMHFLIIGWMVGFQMIMMLSVGFSVTTKGWVHYILQIIVYLFLYYWVTPKFFNKKTRKTGWFRISLVTFIYFVTRGLNSYHGSNAIEFLYFIVSLNQVIYFTANLTSLIALNFLFGLFRRNEQLRQDYIQALQEKIEAEAEKAKIESIVTQMRLSPHLTFNTLNYIKEKADGVIPEIVRAVELYSGIVRHSMTDILTTHTVLLSDEIHKIKDQIELHGLLADGDIFIDFIEDLDESIENATIPPSTLLTFVENIFRYGVVKDPDHQPSISVKMEKRQFIFSTQNYKRLNPHPGTGMGIRSVASTLDYYYPGLHHLQIDENEETFCLTLMIQL